MRGPRAFDVRGALGTFMVLVTTVILTPSTQAQNLIPPDESVASVPDFAGTGLLGLYYDNNAGYSSAAGSPAEASFTTTNICYPDCQGGSFSDGNGGLQAFTNGNATNFNFNTSIEPPRTTWDGSELDISGYIAITTPGTYTFNMGHDDNMSVTIGGQTQAAGCCGFQTFQDTFTTAGLYPISLQFMEGGGGSYMDLTATDPNNNCILGCYGPNGALEENDLFYSDEQPGAPAPVIGGGWPAVVVAGLMAVAVSRRRRLA